MDILETAENTCDLEEIEHQTHFNTIHLSLIQRFFLFLLTLSFLFFFLFFLAFKFSLCSSFIVHLASASALILPYSPWGVYETSKNMFTCLTKIIRSLYFKYGWKLMFFFVIKIFVLQWFYINNLKLSYIIWVFQFWNSICYSIRGFVS